MESTNIKLIGYNILPSFNQEFSVNRFYDIISSDLEEIKYLLHVQSINHDGLPYDEWINFDLKLSNKFIETTKLHSFILKKIYECNKMNSNLISTIIFEDGKGDFNEKITDICIAYYKYV